MTEPSDPGQIDARWTDAGPADLALAATQCRMAGTQRVLIVRDGAGRYFAIAPECSHALLPLEGGRVRGGVILCPHHGARFDVHSGQALGAPAQTGIATWPLRQTGERIEVLL